jgi:hypothetical protein
MKLTRFDVRELGDSDDDLVSFIQLVQITPRQT